MRAHRKRGFTLVELMIVVAIIGVLAALALYGVSRYLKHAKTAEATANLGHIETGTRTQYQRETPYSTGSDNYVHMYCPAAPLTPSLVPKAVKAVPNAAEWNVEGWRCLKFNVDSPHYYAYAFDQNGSYGTAAAFTAQAFGDLDGDGTTSIFEIQGHGGNFGDSVRDVFRVINEDE